MHTRKLIPLALLLSTSFFGNAHAICPAPRTSAELLTPLTAPIPIGAALVARVTQSMTPQPGPEAFWDYTNGASVPGITLVRGDVRIPLRSESIGGGLVRLVPESTPAEGVYVLEGWAPLRATTPPPQIQVTFGGALPPTPAPVDVLRVHHDERSLGTGHWGERRSFTTHLTVSRALPEGLARVALVSTTNDWVYVRQIPGTELYAHDQWGGTHCGEGNPGVGRTSPGMQVKLVLVDNYGRVIESARVVPVR